MGYVRWTVTNRYFHNNTNPPRCHINVLELKNYRHVKQDCGVDWTNNKSKYTHSVKLLGPGIKIYYIIHINVGLKRKWNKQGPSLNKQTISSESSCK